MKRTKITILSALAFGMFACGNSETAESAVEETAAVEENKVESITYNANVDGSTINWRGEMVGGAYFHEGTANLTEGSITMEGENITGGSFTVDMSSLATTDDNYSEEHTSEQLIGHLGTADFFDIENNPTATFVIKEMEGNSIKGDLTVRGTTQEEVIENVTVSNENGEITATGSMVFDRQQFNVSYESTMEDMVISNDITLNISLKANAAN